MAWTLLAALSSCHHDPPIEPHPVDDRASSTEVFQECREQEALGDAHACWSYFLAEYRGQAPQSETEYAEARAEPAPAEHGCAAGTTWDGSTCVSLCDADAEESWDNGEGLCLRRLQLECLEYYHQEDGHCVADATCPDGYRRKAGGGCEPAPTTDLRPGQRVVSLFDHAYEGRVYVKSGEKGTYWHAQDGQLFVIWDAPVGATPVYPGPETGVPQGKNSYAFWVMPDEIVEDSASFDDASLIPQWCGQSADHASFGRIKTGTMVRLARHRPVDGDDNWAADMQTYVGRTTRVRERLVPDSAGCPVVHVDADQGRFAWRVRDLTLAPIVRSVPTTPSGPPK